MQRFISLMPCLLLFALLAMLAGCQTMLFEPKDHGQSRSLLGKSRNFFQPLMPDFSNQYVAEDDDDEYAAYTDSMFDETNSLAARFNRLLQQSGTGPAEKTAVPLQQVQNVSAEDLPAAEFPVVTNSESKQKTEKEIAKKDESKELSAPVPEKKLVTVSTKDINYINEPFDDDDGSTLDYYDKRVNAKEQKNSPPSSDDPPANAPDSSLISRARQLQQYPSIPQLPTAAIPENVEAKYLSAANTQTNNSNNPLRGGVVQAAMTWQTQTDWRGTLTAAADQLWSQLETSPNSRTFANEARLRMMYLLLDDSESAAIPFHSYSKKEFSGYWSNQMLAFSTLLDEKTTYNNTESRLSEVAFRASEGVKKLKELGPMKLKNLQFIDDWNGFGQYMPRPPECRAGESIALYMEIENPLPKKIPLMGAGNGHQVNFIVNYELRDSSGKIVDKVNDLPFSEMSLSLKTDYSLCPPLMINIPENLPRGTYKLRVSVRDDNRDISPWETEELQLKILDAM